MACKVRKQQEGASHAIGSGRVAFELPRCKRMLSLHFLLDHCGKNETIGIILSISYWSEMWRGETEAGKKNKRCISLFMS